MLDAWGKIPTGITQGNLYSPGSFDVCDKLGLDVARYCSIVNFDPLHTEIKIALEIPHILPEKDVGKFPYIFLFYGMCVPPSCDSQNLIESFNNITQYDWIKAKFDATESTLNVSVRCEGKKLVTEDSTSMATLILISLIFIVGVSSTVGDEYWTWKISEQSASIPSVTTPTGYSHQIKPQADLENDTSNESESKEPLLTKQIASAGDGETISEDHNITVEFKRTGVHHVAHLISPLANLHLLITVKESKITTNSSREPDLSVLNGIRVLSFMWVILGHMYFWIVALPSSNSRELYAKFTDFDFMIVLNAFFSVDSFFVLSGFLTAVLILKEIDSGVPFGPLKCVGALIHRYLRITPSYAFVILISASLADYIGSGPFWENYAGVAYNRCKSLWWRNLLYIDAFWTSTDNCLSYGWYLSNDMIFFCLSILILPLFKKHRKIGHFILASILIGSVIACAVLTQEHDLKGFFVGDIIKLMQGDPSGNFDRIYGIIKYIYFKPWARVQPYIIGIYSGFIQHDVGKRILYKKLTFGKSLLLWSIALSLLGLCVFGLNGEQRGIPLSRASNILYISFSRIGWGIGLGALILLCANNRGGYINSFLSLHVWIPFARVGLLAYLIHPLVLDYFFYSLKEPLFYSDSRYAFYFIGCVGMTYALAFLVTAFVESPLRNLEKLGSSRRDK